MTLVDAPLRLSLVALGRRRTVIYLNCALGAAVVGSRGTHTLGHRHE
jgi:hypothetical protein